MNENLHILGRAIIERKAEIAKNVHESRLSEFDVTELNQIAGMEDEIINIRAEFIHVFGQALLTPEDKDRTFDVLVKWGEETGAYIYNLGIPLDEALKDTSYYRTFIWKTIQEEITERKMPIETVFEVISIIDPYLDHAVYCFSVTYVKFHRETLEKANSAFLELSVPVVPLTKGVAVLPLIGNIDTQRAQLLMEETLIQANNFKLSLLFIDLSGVAIVDTMVADRIFKVIASLSLLGVDTILTGIRPEIAQTIVAIGVDFKNVKIRGTLEQAMEDLNMLTHLQTV